MCHGYHGNNDVRGSDVHLFYHIISPSSRHRLLKLQGPPGTGKPCVIGMTVVVCLQDKRKFLLTAETQYAVQVYGEKWA